MYRRRDSVQFLRNYSAWREGRRARSSIASSNGDRRCPVSTRVRSFRRVRSAVHEPKRLDHYRCLRYGRLARVNGRFLFHVRRGCAKISKNEASVLRPGSNAASQQRQQLLHSVDGDTALRDQPSFMEIKSVRFPRVSEPFDFGATIKADTHCRRCLRPVSRHRLAFFHRALPYFRGTKCKNASNAGMRNLSAIPLRRSWKREIRHSLVDKICRIQNKFHCVAHAIIKTKEKAF